MNLLILGGPRAPQRNPSPKYRGTFRNTPYYFETLAADHPFNKMFLSYIEEGGETGILHDLSKAINLAKVWNETQEEVFEVVEVTLGQESPETNGKFLGFDLSQGFNNSLLWRGLESTRSRIIDTHIGVLCALRNEFFCPRLNQHGLFDEFETASFCLQAATALQSFHDCLFEGENLDKFGVVGIYLVSEPHRAL